MKTDNSRYYEKLKIRQMAICEIGKKQISVLELYAGKSVLWNELKRRNEIVKINLLSIEKEKGKNKMALCGDNLKFIDKIDLSRFDIIDIDAYGIPARQIKKIEDRKFKGIVIVTAIQSMFGSIPNEILFANGITKKMINKIPSIFNKKGLDYIKNFLYICGIKQIKGFFDDRKYYFYYKH